MKIGLDYGGVISFAPDGWAESIAIAKTKGHQFYLVSHCQESGMRERQDFCDKTNIINLSFCNLESPTQENEIARRKAELCKQYEIDVFIDDDLNRAAAVGKLCDKCASFYIPQNLWQLGQRVIENL